MNAYSLKQMDKMSGMFSCYVDHILHLWITTSSEDRSWAVESQTHNTFYNNSVSVYRDSVVLHSLT